MADSIKFPDRPYLIRAYRHQTRNKGEGIASLKLPCSERYLGRSGKTLADNPIVRSRLGDLGVEIEAGRAFSYAILWNQITGGLIMAAPMAAAAKILATELVQRFTYVGCDIMGLYGQVSESKWAPLKGKFEKEYQLCPGLNMAGGTSEIMRNLICTLGLGLPRSW